MVSPTNTTTIRLNAACRRALDAGDPTYRTVKGILIAGTETDTTTASATPVVPAHLHGPKRLFVVGDDDSDRTNDDRDGERHDGGADGAVIDLPITIEIEVAS